ncbi:PREDICTED: WD repeat-containing protein 74 [Vollenhovia emeryi]|uniref:WD repeat-containing protein 74 n=1 Tax=Vollenhovia emeryi TaxID=411798 RepID=UPI0005F55B62|nr:PREDICTED: WD repeat-containing protein 74 [Vollenhovia emeryi]
MNRETQFDVFAGAVGGQVKGIRVGATQEENKVENLERLELIAEDDQVTRIAWGGDDEREVLVACGTKDRRVKIFDSDSGTLVRSFPCNLGQESINGISGYKGCILTSVGSGEVCLWSPSGEGEVLVNAGQNLCRMCHSREQENVIATGGVENNVKLYDLEKRERIFIAKDLPHDWLNLKVPVWISDLTFLPLTQQIVAVGRHGHIYVYDPRSQRRPVVNMTAKESWTCLAIAPREKHIVVGSTTGRLNLVDLRKTGTILNTYKDFTGGVTGVACSPIRPYIVSVSLDKYLRIHDIDAKTRPKRIYTKSRLSCLIMRSDITIETKSKDSVGA